MFARNFPSVRLRVFAEQVLSGFEVTPQCWRPSMGARIS
jgi:hypothetical protein